MGTTGEKGKIMKKKDALELTRRMKKDACTFTRMCACYVNPGKEKVLSFGKTFLNLEDEEAYKYLEIAKKTLSGSVGDNLMEFPFPLEQEATGGRQQFLMALRESKLKNEELVDRFFDMVIESYSYAGSYLILLFHDAYDVMTKTTDNNKLDESEEVYEYLLCSICPIVLSKPGLGYLEKENTIGPRIRDKIVSMPDFGFLFPAFTERSSDIHAVVVYNKDAAEPHDEFVEKGLCCTSRLTATEQKTTFQSIVRNTFSEEDEAEETLLGIQKNLSDMVSTAIEENPEGYEEEKPTLNPEEVDKLMQESGVKDEKRAVIVDHYREAFEKEPPVTEHLLDQKMLKKNEAELEKRELNRQMQQLKEQVEAYDKEVTTYDVVLRVKPEKASQIRTQVIDGKKCLVIPMAENEHAAVNGVNTTI